MCESECCSRKYSKKSQNRVSSNILNRVSSNILNRVSSKILNRVSSNILNIPLWKQGDVKTTVKSKIVEK